MLTGHDLTEPMALRDGAKGGDMKISRECGSVSGSGTGFFRQSGDGLTGKFRQSGEC